MQRALVLDSHKGSLMPCNPARARMLLKRKQAAVFRRFPFIIILNERSGGEVQPVELKVDPGSKKTALALVFEEQTGRKVVFAANLEDRGHQVKQSLDSRRAVRRSRGNRNTRYRVPRFLNRTRTTCYLKHGWYLCTSIRRNWTSYGQSRFDRLLAGKRPTRYKDAAVVNAIRYATGDAVKSIGLPTTFWSGGRTRFNRTEQGYNKDHWTDAACVGETGSNVKIANTTCPLTIKATGRESRQMCRVNEYGFPQTKAKSAKIVRSFQTGDIVKAVVLAGKKQGTHIGKVAVRVSGSFNIAAEKTIQGISHRFCTLLQRNDGYPTTKQHQSYRLVATPLHPITLQKDGVSRGEKNETEFTAFSSS